MLIEWLYELKDQIDRHGIRVGLILTLFVMYRKELRNMRLDMRDKALFQNIKIMMEERGLGAQWIGQPKVSHKDLMNYKQLQQSYSVGISQVGFLFRRRGRRMNKAWVITLVTYILSVVAAKWGIELPDGTPEIIVNAITAIVNAVMVLIPIVLAFMNKTKKPEVPVNEPRIYGESNK